MQLISETTLLRLGFTPNNALSVPKQLEVVIGHVIETYRRHHPDLLAIYVVGSVVNGDWLPGVSDLDVIGIIKTYPDTDSETRRREELVAFGEQVPQVSFIDTSVLSLSTLSTNPDVLTLGKAQIIAISSLLIWGQAVNFSEYFPTVVEMARQRTVRAEALMRKYYSGDLIEPFRRNEQLLARSCAKATIRVLSSIAILRGAPFYTSPFQTFETVQEYVPEALEIGQHAIAIIQGEYSTPEVMMALTDKAIALYKLLCPNG